MAVAAVIFAAGFAIYEGLTSQWTYQEQTLRSAKAARDHAHVQVERYCVPLPADHERDCRRDVEDSYRDNFNEARNLEAQRTTAVWTALMGGAALLGMAVSIIGVGLVFITFRAAREGNEISRQTMMAENRAWIEIEILSLGGLRYENGEFRLKVRFRLRNIGQSVALNVASEVALIGDPMMGQRKIGEVSGRLQEIYERLKRYPSKLMAQNIFPSRESPEQEWDTAVRADDVQLMAGEEPSNLYPMALVLGVRYNTIFDSPEDTGHQTIELGSIRRVDDHGRPGLVIVGRNSIPAQEIRLLHPPENLGVVT